MRYTILLALLATVVLNAAETQAPTAGAEALIKDLASEDFALRERATCGLIAMGAKVLPALKAEHEACKDAESKARIGTILEFLEGGGPVVDGIKVMLSATRKEIRPNESVTLTVKVFNVSNTSRKLRIVAEAEGQLFLTKKAYAISDDEGKVLEQGQNGDDSPPYPPTKDVLVPAYGVKEFTAEWQFVTFRIISDKTAVVSLNSNFELGDLYLIAKRGQEQASDLAGAYHFQINLEVARDTPQEIPTPDAAAAWHGQLQSNTVDIKVKE